MKLGFDRLHQHRSESSFRELVCLIIVKWDWVIVNKPQTSVEGPRQLTETINNKSDEGAVLQIHSTSPSHNS